MKVLVDGKIYNSDLNALCIRFTKAEIKNIKKLSGTFDTYVAAPKAYPLDDKIKLIRVLKPEAFETKSG